MNVAAEQSCVYTRKTDNIYMHVELYVYSMEKRVKHELLQYNIICRSQKVDLQMIENQKERIGTRRERRKKCCGGEG